MLQIKLFKYLISLLRCSISQRKNEGTGLIYNLFLFIFSNIISHIMHYCILYFSAKSMTQKKQNSAKSYLRLIKIYEFWTIVESVKNVGCYIK